MKLPAGNTTNLRALTAIAQGIAKDRGSNNLPWTWPAAALAHKAPDPARFSATARGDGA